MPTANPSIDRMPAAARAAWTRLRDELRRILGEDLVAMWAYGGTITAPADGPLGDLDTFVVVRGTPDLAKRGAAIETAQATIAADSGVEWDDWYVTDDMAARAELPTHAFRDRLNESWAIDRAHWLAGRYVLLHGAEPADVVPAATPAEIAASLEAEVDHLERHVAAGDTDPYEATYAFLNGSRIVRAVETGDVVISKREAGAWGLEHLGERWQPALDAARRAYDGHASAEDLALLAREMAPFVAMVRQALSSPAGAGGASEPSCGRRLR